MGYWLNVLTHFEDEFLTLPNLDFITAHSSLITAQMAVLPPYFRSCVQESEWDGLAYDQMFCIYK